MPGRPRDRATAARTRADASRPRCYAFRTPTALAPRLVDAGFTHLNLANNHANDFGPAGRASTERMLDSLGLRLYGPLGRIAIDTVRRGDSLTTVGLIGFATYPFAYDLLDIERSAAVVDSIRAAGGSADRHLPRRRRRGREPCTSGEAAESLGASRAATCAAGLAR